jgi:release factor glutamine methyltransferase
VTVAEAVRNAARQLATVSDTSRFDAELLMAHALEVDRSELLLRHMDAAVPATFASLVERRAAHEPVAYIVGRQEFYGLSLEVTSAVLIPRADSETLIEAAREALAARAPRRILDLGTGSGALLLAALATWPEASGIGVDRSAASLDVARRNAQRLGLAGTQKESGRISLVAADWHASGWAEELGHFDLVLCNPPYVENEAVLEPSVREWEPTGALFAGADGLDDYQALIPQLAGLLADNGIGVFEIGSSQPEAVSQIAKAHGFAADLRHDLAHRPRALVLRLGLGKEPARH